MDEVKDEIEFKNIGRKVIYNSIFDILKELRESVKNSGDNFNQSKFSKKFHKILLKFCNNSENFRTFRIKSSNWSSLYTKSITYN